MTPTSSCGLLSPPSLCKPSPPLTCFGWSVFFLAESSKEMEQIQFPSFTGTTVGITSPNLFAVNCKNVPPSHTPLPQNKRAVTKNPKKLAPFPTSLLALSPDKLELSIHSKFNDEDNIPAPAKEAIGKTMYPRAFALSHSTAHMLSEWGRHGCPADCGKPWSRDQIMAALRRGPHQSAASPEASVFLHDEVNEKVKSGYARVVKWGAIKNNIPPNLKISPVALVPHKSRQWRTILDLSFSLRYKGGIIPSVNSSTVKQAPAEAMVQLGQCFQRILYTMATNYNPQQPFAFAKLDIKDGFWRMRVSEKDAWNFCYVLPPRSPTQSLDEREIVVPASLQMGWCESPPYFCAATETARDVIDNLLASDLTLPDHRFLETMLENSDSLPRLQASAFTVNLLEVFVDDFCAITNDLSKEHLTRFSKALIHGIHSVFPPPELSKHPGEDPISQKKLEAGDGTWATTKELLGWLVDGVNYTVHLSPDRCAKITKLITRIAHKPRCPLQKFQQVAGKLQHASFAIPGGKGLFSPIYRALQGTPPVITITPLLKSALLDWRTIIHQFAASPSPIRLLIPQPPHFLQYTDACFLGCGGITSPGLAPLPHVVWQFAWPPDIRKLIESSLSINDLELAGIVMGWLVLEALQKDLQFKHVGMFSDNSASVAWTNKGCSTSSLPAARLLRFLSLRQRTRQTSSLISMHIEGANNAMADVSSRAFKNGAYFAAHANLVDYFNTNFPLPQRKSWIEYKVPKKLSWRVISCLRGEQLPMESLTRLPKLGTSIGDTGVHTSLPARQPHPLNANHPSTKPSSSRASLSGSGQALTDSEIRSRFSPYTKRWQPSPRPSSWVENPVPSSKVRANTLLRSDNN